MRFADDVLLIDIGNTRIKWARLARGRLSRQRAMAHAGWRAADFVRQVFEPARSVQRIVVVSVAGETMERVVIKAARQAVGVIPQFVRSRRRAGNVRTRYQEPWRLGADRFVAAIAAYRLARGRPVCVADIGTAMTLDLVDAHGVHRGGAIVPGPELMVRSLLQDTHGIARRASGRAVGRSLFARSTRAAIEAGARCAVAAAIDRAVQEAAGLLGRRPLLLLTGGAAPAVERWVRTAKRRVPDLVLQGLATLAGTGI